MRILLFIYVGVFLLLNALIDEEIIFFFALTTFPVSLYLLLTKPKKHRSQHFISPSSASYTLKKEEENIENPGISFSQRNQSAFF